MEKRKRPLSVRAILQQPGAKKFARATSQQDAAHSVPFAQSEAERCGPAEGDLWQQMYLAEAARQPEPRPRPAAEPAAPAEFKAEVAENRLWQEMRRAEAYSQSNLAQQPSSRSKHSKCWNVRNLTHEKERFETIHGLNALRRELKRAQERESQEENRFAVLRLELLKQKSFITDEHGEGEDWQAVSEAASDLVENTAQALEQAEELHEQIRLNAATLKPGSEMVQSCADLQEAHETIIQLKKQLKQVEKRKEAARSLVLIQHEMDQLQNDTTRRRPSSSELEAKIQRLERNSLFTEIVKAESEAEGLPEVNLQVKPSKELRKMRGQHMPLKEVLGQLETEWAFHFKLEENALTLPVKPFMMALKARSPSNDKHNDKVILVLMSPSDLASKYLEVDVSSAQTVQRYGKKPPDAVPTALQLIRSLLGFNSQVFLMAAVQQLIRKALQCRAVEVPQNLQAKLRKYQAQGFRWLASNAENGIGSLLADDMGLGKTLQSAVLLQYLRDEGHITAEKPALVVVPFSVLRNWQSELQRWTPSVRTQLYHGKDRSLEGDTGEVLITTYGVVQTDQEMLSGFSFACIVLDEGQYIKNRKSLTAQAVKKVAAECGSSCARVALTGTPIENHLGELFSILEFLNPGFLGSKEEFLKNFNQPLQKASGREAALARFRALVGPFMLRRLKDDKAIAPELPDKVEYEYMVEMTEEQSELYTAWTEKLLQKVPREGAIPDTNVQELQEGKSSSSGRYWAVFTLLHRLQQVVNHPAAMPREHQLKAHAHDVSKSGKMTKLLELLQSIWEDSQEKVLIFTQYRDTQQLLAELLGKHFPDLRPLLFHGGLNSDQRQKAVDAFSGDASCRVLILTLKAGGIGLNLTAASHVVHFDRCWNPAKEAQATDRAHRIGQHRTVLVHRFTTMGSFEERLAQIVAGKKFLADSTMSRNSSSGDIAQAISGLSDSQLRQLFNLTQSNG